MSTGNADAIAAVEDAMKVYQAMLKTTANGSADDPVMLLTKKK